MTEELRRRDDIQTLVKIEVVQAMTSYTLTVARHESVLEQLQRAVFGDAATGAPGLVKQLGDIGNKLDVLIQQQTTREEDWKAMREFLSREQDREVVLRAVATSLKRVGQGFKIVAAGAAGIATIIGLLQLFGVIHL